MRIGKVAAAFEQRGHRSIDSPPWCSKPQLLDPPLIHERRRQVGLWVEIEHCHRSAELVQHPGDVVDERRLAHAANVVEERYNRHRHRFSLTIAATAPMDAWAWPMDYRLKATVGSRTYAE